MKKTIILLCFLTQFTVRAQHLADWEVGLRFQKTEQLYWENGIGVDFSSERFVNKHIHLKMSYASSRFGSALIGNAVRQDNILIGADWRFRPQRAFQIFTGLNSGFFHADMENAIFNQLPHNSLMLSVEAGLYYRFKFPIATSLSAGYNLISGDGVTGPGTLFPVFYQLSVYYCLDKK